MHSSNFCRLAIRCAALVALAFFPPVSPVAAQDWPRYASDDASSKYSALDQIDRGNVHELEIVWRWSSIDFLAAEKHEGMRVRGTFETSPVKLGDRLLLSTGLGMAASADPATGEPHWLYDPYEMGEQLGAVGFGSTRGGTSWTDGDKSRFFLVSHGDLVSLDVETGKPDPEFGEEGRVSALDLPDGARRRAYRWTSSPLVCGEHVVLGESTNDAWVRKKNPPGLVRSYDIHTGELEWVFYIVPREGEPGYETWEDGSADYTGAGNVWTWMSCDPDLGAVFAATSTPSNDWYGGHRLGAGLYAESILSLDVETGERNWHFQAVHHGIWDYDFPAAPVLADVTVDGRQRKLLAQVSKQAFLYVFDRETGEPMWPIVEVPVPPSDVPGEVAWPTQPHPSWPLPYDRQGLVLDDLVDFTPGLRAMALDYVSQYRLGPVFQPPGLIENADSPPSIQLPGPVGGSNWNGAGLDPETGVLYVPSVTAPALMGLREPPDKGRSDLRYRVDLGETDGYAWVMLPNGLPLTKPPYGRITAIDLATGEHVWMVPNGDGPRDHEAIRHLDLPPLGHPGRASPLVTKTLLFVADGSTDMPVVPTGGGGRMFRAYDKKTGEKLWEKQLEAGVSGAPMTYMHDGRQFIVLPLSEADHPPELVALALPSGGPAQAR